MRQLQHISNPQARMHELDHRVDIMRPEEIRELLIESLSDPYPPLRHAAALHLSNYMDEDTLGWLLSVITDTQAHPVEVVRASCVALKGASGEPAVYEALLSMLNQQDSDARYLALETLFDLNPSRPVIEQAARLGIEDPDEEVAMVAAQIIATRRLTELEALLIERRARTGRQRLHFTLSLAEIIRPQTAQANTALIDDMTQELFRALRYEETSVAGAVALGQFGKSLGDRGAIIEALQRQLNRWLIRPHFRIEAAVALLELGHQDGHDHITQQLKSRKKDVRGYAIEVAGRYRIDALFEDVLKIANAQEFASETAILALHAYDTPAARRALERIAQTHPDEDCRQLAKQLTMDTDGSLKEHLE